MLHIIKEVSTLSDYVLLVGFEDGAYRKFDLKKLMNENSNFEILKQTKGLYESAKVDKGGYGIIWNDELDISGEGIYEKGIPCMNPRSENQ